MRLFSIGHSSMESETFVALLEHYGIKLLVDVRSYPGSRRHPHFNKDKLAELLTGRGIVYLHMGSLGGIRRVSYVEYMGTEEFSKAIDKLLSLSERYETAFMCAEKDWRKCHRRFIAQELVKRGAEVLHIVSFSRVEAHPKLLYSY